MKKSILIVALGFATQTYSQNCDSLKKENDYLKSALSIREINSNFEYTTPNRVALKFDKAIGDKTQKTVTLKCHLVNKVSLQKFVNIQSIEVFDFEGNKMTNFEISTKQKLYNASDSKYAEIELVPDIPFKFDIILKDFEKEVPIIKSIRIKSNQNPYPETLKVWEFYIESVKVEWK